MTPLTSQADTNLQTELDRLTYSAYLLTLDPGKAFSAVARAIDGSLEETSPNSDLLERTVELALEEVLFESEARWDGESSAYDVLLYGRSAAINSKAFQSLQDLDGSPILLLDSTSRIAFVLHHLLGFKISDAAVKARLTEKHGKLIFSLPLSDEHLPSGIPCVSHFQIAHEKFPESSSSLAHGLSLRQCPEDRSAQGSSGCLFPVS